MDKINKTVFIISFLISWIALDCFATDLNKKSLIFVYADWCQPCRIVHKEINNKNSLVSLLIESYRFKKINFDVDKDLVKMYNITAVPTLIVIDREEEIRLVGIKNGISDVITFLMDNK